MSFVFSLYCIIDDSAWKYESSMIIYGKVTQKLHIIQSEIFLQGLEDSDLSYGMVSHN